MKKEDFALWLQGWVELSGGVTPNDAQWKMIREHLALAFNKVTPPLSPMPDLNKLINNGNDICVNDLSRVPLGPAVQGQFYPGRYPLPYIGDIPSINNISC